MRVAAMAAALEPRSAPETCSCPVTQRAPQILTLENAPYDAPQPRLPALDPLRLEPIERILVHGSAATADSCAFSDVDIAVFVDDTRCYPAHAHRDAIAELRGLLHAALAHDPLMHHGLMFAPASALQGYDQRFLPVETLRTARVLHGSPAFDVHLLERSAGEAKATLVSCAQSLARRVQTPDFLADDFQFKTFLSGALLMPARVLAARGVHVYKRESFKLAHEFFTARQWEFIARCEALRSLWVRPPAPLPHRLVPTMLHPRLRQIFGASCSPRLNVRRLSSVMVDGLLKSAQLFLRRVETLA